ncbi:Ribosomal protein L1/ribosomal biogenesis protein [Trinorchestia longiramus]|nr:Ribosomal protein L1/ribosomal biogenesis protein [Trinorchestia longiramus]
MSLDSSLPPRKRVRVRRRKPYQEAPTPEALAKKPKLSMKQKKDGLPGKASKAQQNKTTDKKRDPSTKMVKSVKENENANSDLKKLDEVVDSSKMEKCISTLLKQYCQQDSKDGEGKKSLFAEALPQLTNKRRLCLTIDSFKVPPQRSATKPTHPKIFRFPLPHGLTDAATSVLLVTKDYPKPKNPRLSNDHYRRFITSAGCNHLITEIMSIGQLRDEYSVLSARKELFERMDVVLCDNAVALVVPRVLGKLFLTSKKFPIGVKMSKKDLKKEIEEKLRSTCHKMTFKNSQSSLVFGHAAQPVQHLVENLHASLAHLCKSFPGGLSNIKTLYLSMGLKARVPLYISTEPSSKVQVPKPLPVPTPEVLEGDFGFGTVKITSFGDVLSYKPVRGDEEDLLHVVPGLDEHAKSKYRKLREAREREERANNLWAKKKRFGHGKKKEAQEMARKLKKQNFKEVPLV